jgi:hypothetical protein
MRWFRIITELKDDPVFQETELKVIIEYLGQIFDPSTLNAARARGMRSWHGDV